MKRIVKSEAAKAAKLGVAKTGRWISGKANPLETLKALTDAFHEYARIVETERTARQCIEADERVAIESLRLKRDLFMDYMSRSFDERRNTFEQLFARMDEAITRGDTKTSSEMLVVIVDLAKASPFKGILDIDELKDSIYQKRRIDF